MDWKALTEILRRANEPDACEEVEDHVEQVVNRVDVVDEYALPQVSRRGRPSKYSPTVRDRVISIVRHGYSLAEAADLVGISRPTIYHWRRKFPEFDAMIFDADVESRCESPARSSTETELKILELIRRGWYARSIALAVDMPVADVKKWIASDKRYPDGLAPAWIDAKSKRENREQVRKFFGRNHTARGRDVVIARFPTWASMIKRVDLQDLVEEAKLYGRALDVSLTDDSRARIAAA